MITVLKKKNVRFFSTVEHKNPLLVFSSARVEATTDVRIYLIIWCIAYIGTQCSVYMRFKAKADKYKHKIYTYLRLRLFITTCAYLSGARNNIMYTRQPSSRDVSIKWEVIITHRYIRISIRTLAVAAYTGDRMCIIKIIENSGGHDGSDQYFCPLYASLLRMNILIRAQIWIKQKYLLNISSIYCFPNYK